MAKPALYGEDAASCAQTQAVLHRVLSIGLRLLHPIMPYITEELWQALPGSNGFIAVAPWPSDHPEWCDNEAEATVAVLQEITRAVRAIRAEKGVPPSARVRVAVRSSLPLVAESLTSCGALLGHLARVAECEQLPESGEKPRGTFTQVTESGIEVLLYAEGAVDPTRERERLDKEIASTSERLARVRAKLANGDFTGRAPAEVVAQERAREAELAAAVERLRAALEDVAG